MLAVLAHVAHELNEHGGVFLGIVFFPPGEPLSHTRLKPHGARDGCEVGTLKHDCPLGGVQEVEETNAAPLAFPRPARFKARFKVLQRAGYQPENNARLHGYCPTSCPVLGSM